MFILQYSFAFLCPCDTLKVKPISKKQNKAKREKEEKKEMIGLFHVRELTGQLKFSVSNVN